MSNMQADDDDDAGGERTSGPDAVLRALADPNRRQIVRLVRSNELAAGEIATHFQMTQQAVSLHLKVLERAGVLTERRQGAKRLYSFRPESLDTVRAVLTDLWPAALARLKHVVEHDIARQRQQEHR